MRKEVSLVPISKGSHRSIAQGNWGLTKEQMKGMHVHHRIPVSEGGTNDPTNLYVCSPWFHAWVWHGGCYFTEKAIEGGRKGGPKGGKALWERMLNDSELQRAHSERTAENARVATAKRETRRKNDPEFDAKLREHSSSVGKHYVKELNNSPKYADIMLEARKKGAEGMNKTMAANPEKYKPIRSEAGKKTCSQKWQCTVTGYITNPGNLSKYQKKRGIDTKNRKRVG